MLPRSVALAVLLSLGSLAAAPRHAIPEDAARALDQVSRDSLRAYVQTLASDDLRGRGVGDEGNRAAERFIAETFRAEGVPPGAADGSYFQAVELIEPQAGPGGRLTVTRDGAQLQDVAAANDDLLPLQTSGAHAVTAPLVDAAYGLTTPQGRHDDYAKLDVREKIVLIRGGVPDSVRSSPLLSDDDRYELSSPDHKVEEAWKHGAAGVLLVPEVMPSRQSLWPEHPSVRSADYRLASDVASHPGPAMVVAPSLAEPILRALAAHQTLTASLVPGITGRTVTVHNVLGLIEGSDLRRRSQMVVVGAHLDHDGTDDEGRIYNGADDNASGSAAVLAAAAAFARAAAHGARPATAVLFALWNGEEKGELGAERFVEAPEPARQVIANINLDMVGRHEEVTDPEDWRFHGLPKTDPQASANTLHLLGYTMTADLARTIVEANAAVGLKVLEDYDHGAQNLLHRSDHWPFLARGIPAVFLTTGLHPDYHRPSDDVERIDFAKLERVARLTARAAWLTADGPPPQMVKNVK